MTDTVWWNRPAPLFLSGEWIRAFQDYSVILRPDRCEPGWWAGAPSVVRDEAGTFWLACRMRTGEGERGFRGYALRILRSHDGVRFETVHEITREAAGVPGFERPCLVRDPRRNAWRLYACTPWERGAWAIVAFEDAPHPSAIRADSVRLVLRAPEKREAFDTPPEGFKDPVITFACGRYHLFAIGYTRANERVFHFTSEDGNAWQPVGHPYQPIMDLCGWHDFFVRPASVLPLGIGWFFVYEGSSTTWYDPVYNIATGIAFTWNLHTVIDLTPQAPLLTSATPDARFGVFRYSSWVRVGEILHVYAEESHPDGTHELRLHQVPLEPSRRLPVIP